MTEKTMTDVLVDHQRHNLRSCLCGWDALGKSHPEHQEAMLTAAGFGPVKAAAAGALREAATEAEYELDLVDEPKENAPSSWLRARAATIESDQ